MADTAAFFAKKKKGKKGFKSFNANKIDISTVHPTAHVDAPKLSDKATASNTADLKVDDGWANNTITATSNTWDNAANGGESKVAELLDMQKVLNAGDDVAERLRIEETKAQLARAKEGMAKEAERLEREKKEKEDKATFRKVGASATANSAEGGGGGKWVPSHLRGGGGGGSSIRGPSIMGGGGTGINKQPNMADEELFPDLADADKILAEKEKMEKLEQERGIRAPTGWGSKNTSTGIGAGANNPPSTSRQPLNLAPRSEEVVRKPLNLAPPTKKEQIVDVKVEEKKVEEEVKTETVPTPATAIEVKAPAEEVKTETTSIDAPKKDIKLKKKKKKDLSSFKPS